MAEQGLSRTERLVRERKSLKSKLGLGGPIELMDTSELVKDEDLEAEPAAAAAGRCKKPGSKGQKGAADLLSEMTGVCCQQHCWAAATPVPCSVVGHHLWDTPVTTAIGMGRQLAVICSH